MAITAEPEGVTDTVLCMIGEDGSSEMDVRTRLFYLPVEEA